MRKSTTKRALVTSVMALFLCFTMLLGTTFAWFTDTASSEGNKIVAGTLDVNLLMHNGTEYVDISANSDPIFGTNSIAANDRNTLWEPGKTQVAYLAIENAGNLDLKYSVILTVSDPEGDLYEVMEYAITPDATPDAPVTAWNEANALPIIAAAQPVSGSVALGVGATHYFALSLHMMQEADDRYQGKELSFDITVRASQLSSESDSFDNGYDALAPFADGSFNFSLSETVQANDEGKFASSDATNTVKITGTAAPGSEIKTDVAPAIPEQGTLDFIDGTGKSVASYDIHVEGQADGSVVTVEVYLGKNLVDVKGFHEGAMMNTAEFSYDSLTGFATVNTTGFSVFDFAFYQDDAGILPKAKVTVYDEEDLPSGVSTANSFLGIPSEFENINLQTAYIFEATETEEEAIASDYRRWNADFVITFDKDVEVDSLGIAGQYTFWSESWLAFTAPAIEDFDGDGEFDGIKAGTSIRLLYDAKKILINYEELCRDVKEFHCGAFNFSEENIGTTLTVELRLYETKDIADSEYGNTWNEETGFYYTMGVFNYTFDSVTTATRTK
ncbi:MAG: hypothetical protein J6W28_02070 [Clostridia bacterium]|nr:hypothetical protein [Clostridia bacterium]